MVIKQLFKPNKVIFLIDKIQPYCLALTLILFGYGFYLAVFASPADYQQGEFVRIMYVHVPAAWMSLMIYSFMAVASIIYLIFALPIANEFAKSSAPIGIIFTFITLVTGSLWGKPIWGTWWVWDARLTSMLILFFFYLGYIMLANALENQLNSKAPAILAIFGFINIPIVKFSVNLWNSLHQPASIIRLGGPTIDYAMLKPLFIMILASFFYYLCNVAFKLKIRLIEYKIERLQHKLMK